MAKKLSKDYDVEAQSATFEFDDGSKQTICLSELKPEIVVQLALHGLVQKGGDACASKDTTQEYIDSVAAVLKQLRDGEWSSRREGTGGPRVGLLVEALAKCTGRSMEECLKAVEGLNDEQKKALRADPNIRKMIAQIRFEREQAKTEKGDGQVDLQALMAQGIAASDAGEDDSEE